MSAGDGERRKSVDDSALTPFESVRIEEIQNAVEELRNKLANHPIYKSIKSLEDVKHFMSMHFYCVWDFMNLVKRLQMDMTCSTLPFKPAQNKVQENIRRFVNEIILEEESDEIGDNFTSHFTYYKMAFADIETEATKNGSYDHVLKFHEVMMNENLPYEKVIKLSSIPKPAQTFLASTQKQATNKNVIHAASSFTFGREDVLPSIFMALINQPFIKDHGNLKMFEIYLDRHIALDGDIHSVLAKKMIAQLCKTDDDWAVAKESAMTAIRSRLAYWDAVKELIDAKNRGSVA